jgi:hypothetical protein
VPGANDVEFDVAQPHFALAHQMCVAIAKNRQTKLTGEDGKFKQRGFGDADSAAWENSHRVKGGSAT